MVIDLRHVTRIIGLKLKMAEPIDPVEHALVLKAITCHLTNCCVWDDRAKPRFEKAPPLPGLTPYGVMVELKKYVDLKGKVVQVRERRPQYDDRPFYYKAVVPIDGLRHGLFIEIVLDDDDPDYPVVRIVNCHEQRK